MMMILQIADVALLVAVFAMFLAIISPSSSCSSYSWNESVRHFSFHNENKSVSTPGLLG